MDIGALTLCLPAKDLDASRRFYEALGMQVVEEVPGTRVVLQRGHLNLALMPFLDEPWLNFRGADVLALHAALRDDPGIAGVPERYARAQNGADADGVCWSLRDPAGNVVFFDTNRNEEGDDARRRRLARLLESTEQELIELGASDCLRAFREEVLARLETK